MSILYTNNFTQRLNALSTSNKALALGNLNSSIGGLPGVVHPESVNLHSGGVSENSPTPGRSPNLFSGPGGGDPGGSHAAEGYLDIVDKVPVKAKFLAYVKKVTYAK